MHRAYQSLTRNDPVQPADLIFVLAGRMERKQYGLELFRAGWAPRLILSVDRFEVRKMRLLEIESSEALVSLRDQTAPEERSFFVHVDHSGVRAEKVTLRRWSTYGEALRLRELLEKENLHHVLVVSTAVHLRRVALAFRHAFAGLDVHFQYCPVPERLDSLQENKWWTHRQTRRMVISEAVKLVAYGVILAMPAWAIRYLMRLKP